MLAYYVCSLAVLHMHAIHFANSAHTLSLLHSMPIPLLHGPFLRSTTGGLVF